LWLNINRTIIRQEIPIYCGVQMAMSKEPNTEILKFALSNTPEHIKNEEELK